MDKINEVTLTGIDRYFNTLKTFGATSKHNTNGLLVMLLIK